MSSLADRLRASAVGVSAALLSAAALWRGTGLAPVWWMTWLAPLPAFVVALRSRPLAGATIAFSAWFAGSLNLWPYLRGTLGAPAHVAFVAAAVPALVVAGGVLLARAHARRHSWTLALLALPTAWTAFELASARLSPHGAFGSLGPSQADCLPVVQLAALAGGGVIGFMVFLVASAVAVAALPGTPRRTIALALAATIALAFGYGAWRLSNGVEAGDAVVVGLAASDAPEQPAAVASPAGRDLLGRLAVGVATLHAAGARTIVLPETTLRVEDGELAGTLSRLAASLDEGSILVVGLDRVAADGERNTALAVGSGGRVLATYRKRHLLSPFESRYLPGAGSTVVRVGSLSAGLAVCKDLDFPALGRENAHEGATIVLAPAWDFTVDGWLHARMAVLRAVESGFALARAAREGRLTLSDSRGRVLAEARSDATPTTTILAHVPLGPAGTPYSRLGDWLGWLSVLLLLVSVAKAAGVRS
jgi:apolipoprotein N-acyltransferase